MLTSRYLLEKYYEIYEKFISYSTEEQHEMELETFENISQYYIKY